MSAAAGGHGFARTRERRQAPPGETRTLLTFPTPGLPSPRICAQPHPLAFPVRYPAGGAAPSAHAQVNRWLCCRCAEGGYWDPVGMGRGSGSGRGGTGTDIGTGKGRRVDEDGDGGGNGGEQDYNACWRDSCRHRKCVNCALYPGPLGYDSSAKLLIRTVGGLYASPRFIDPVYWECAACGEWMRNRFDSRSTLGLMGCRNEGCVFAWRAGRAQLGTGAGERGAGDSTPGAGVLMAASVVMNRYGQRLGMADQRVAVADGPWDWQRKALGDARCAIVAGLRAVMKRTGEGSGADGSRIGRLWVDGEPVPQYPYRRPPPLDENDMKENYEYEALYLAGIPAESSNTERTSLAAAQSAAVNSSSSAFFPGWNHSQ
ncbi:hypothetical protein F5144DRAFT_596256 [Chaetomium tenue]|uniref:Uncharacterized protein n=1 Tax=Chaetomium tenue TaxID=1854479 RepID=A0ACB7NWX3_9PEZI|nr:hypothetical protein F5144DRAFT_596256 [Chaetomium globosum]